ncbi:hypothetical protein TNCV_1746701 [Trichonephila clavipes]|nr:hypothetical protein TNCV_1746701 [Trichonephila clavipes]
MRQVVDCSIEVEMSFVTPHGDDRSTVITLRKLNSNERHGLSLLSSIWGQKASNKPTMPPSRERQRKNSSVCRNKNRYGLNCTRLAVVNRVQEDVGKGAPSDHPHTPEKFQGDGQFVQQ